MSLTYLLLNGIGLLVGWLIFKFFNRQHSFTVLEQKSLMITGLIAYALMVVFNTYLTSLPIVRYNSAKILGIKILSWPIEDLAYLVVALYITPVMFKYWKKVYANRIKQTHQGAGQVVRKKSAASHPRR